MSVEKPDGLEVVPVLGSFYDDYALPRVGVSDITDRPKTESVRRSKGEYLPEICPNGILRWTCSFVGAAGRSMFNADMFRSGTTAGLP